MYRVAIITASDKGAAGLRQDKSGPLAKELLEQEGYQVVSLQVLSDDRESLAAAMKKICDEGKADLLLTTGGTGLSPRDWTPEATMDIAQRMVPGISEGMRAYSLSITKRAMLSRGVSAIRERTWIINLPGSPKAVQENLEYLLPVLPHGLDVLTGAAQECAETTKRGGEKE